MPLALNSPLRSLLVQNSASTLLASDRIRSSQGKLGTAVAADVVHQRVLAEVDDAAWPREGLAAAGRRAGACGDLVLFAGHDNCAAEPVVGLGDGLGIPDMSQRVAIPKETDAKFRKS